MIKNQYKNQTKVQETVRHLKSILRAGTGFSEQTFPTLVDDNLRNDFSGNPEYKEE